MKIAIDARMMWETGIGTYIENLIDNLSRLDKKNEYFILYNLDDYFNSRRAAMYNNTNFKRVAVHSKWYSLKEQFELPKILNKIKPDLVHFPHFNVPILYKGKFVVTIHDLIHEHHSMQRDATTRSTIAFELKKIGYKKVFNHAIKNSTKILTPTEFVKKQLMDEKGINENKIIVTNEAVGEFLSNIIEKTTKDFSQKILKDYKIKSPYIFYLGNAYPHKNVEGLIKSFIILKKKYPNLYLVLGGKDNLFWKRIKGKFHIAGIRFFGYVFPGQMSSLYKNALCFVMPSFEEGFGLPALEAMASGCPVVSSNTGALKEVGGDAALYFDPKNIGDMANKISEVLNSEKLRKELIEKGKKRVKEFSWKKMAEQTLEVYEQCA